MLPEAACLTERNPLRQLSVIWGPFLSATWKSKLDERFSMKGDLEHADPLRAMQSMGALLVIHSDEDGADEVIPAKLFEYMQEEQPIFVAGPPNMESARIERDYKFGHVANILDKKDPLAVLNNMIRDWQLDKEIKYSLSDLSQVSRPKQYSKPLSVLK